MKPIIDHKKCFADIKICTAKTSCPVKAIGFVKVEEPMLDKEFTDKTDRCPFAPSGLMIDIATPEWNEYKLGRIGTEDNPVPMGDPYVRVVIDYDKCTNCGLCVEGCCGYAIEMVDDDKEVEQPGCCASKDKKSCCC